MTYRGVMGANSGPRGLSALWEKVRYLAGLGCALGTEEIQLFIAPWLHQVQLSHEPCCRRAEHQRSEYRQTSADGKWHTGGELLREIAAGLVCRCGRGCRGQARCWNAC